MATGTLLSTSSPEWTRWLSVLSDLNYDPASGIAPHKPLLLLVVCDLAEAGKLDGALFHRDGDLAFRFSSYWRIVADRRRTKPDVRLPFFHLRTEGVWNPLEVDGRPAEDRKRAVLAQLSDDYTVLITSQPFDERGDAAHLLKPRAGNPILRPITQHHLPDRASLRWHRQRHGFERQ